MPVGRKNDKVLGGGLKDTGQVMPYRDDKVVDRIVGEKRNAQQIGTSFFGWPLWQRYRTWCQHLDDVAEKRKGEK
jgi:hypothetical protein